MHYRANDADRHHSNWVFSCIAFLLGCEKMGLAPNSLAVIQANNVCHEVPVPIFSQPLSFPGGRIMFEKSISCGDPCEQITAKNRRKEIMRFILCSLAAMAAIYAAGIQAKAGDEANSKTGNATAYLRIALNEKMLVSATGQNIQTEFDIYRNTQKQLLLNPLVLRAALMNPEINNLSVIKDQKNPKEWLKKNLQITFPDNSEIMQVSLPGADQRELAMVVNAVVDAYITNFVDAERQLRNLRISELRNVQVEKEQEIKDALNQLRRMAQSLGTSESESLNLKQKNTLDDLAAVRSEAIRGQFELNRLNGELASLKAAREAVDNQPITDAEVGMAFSADPILRELGEALVHQQQEQEQMSETIKEESKSSTVQQQLLNKIGRIKKQYDLRLEQLRQELHNKKLNEIDRDIKKHEAMVEIAKKQLDINLEEVKELRKEADRFGFSSIDMQMRRTGIAAAQKSLDAITADIEKLRLESHSSPRVTVLNKAEAPE
jgi:polysaccharide biosynthesis transport protein